MKLILNCKSKLILTVFYFSITCSYQALANHALIFTDLSQKTNFKLDLKHKEYLKDGLTGKYTRVGELITKNIDTTALFQNFDINVFKVKGKYLLTLQGTGQVYLFDEKIQTLERIDKTKFAGYNFQSICFFHNDTLFSVGGQGFWQRNNMFTYFNMNTKEWDLYAVQIDGPQRILNINSGYVSLSKTLYATNQKLIYVDDEISKPQFFKFDFPSKKWQKLGIINKVLLEADYQYSDMGNIFVYLTKTKSLWSIPDKNKVYIYRGSKHKFFTPDIDLYFNKNWIYLTHTNTDNTVEIDSISIDELQKNSEEIGPMYETETNSTTYIIIFALISLVATTWFYTDKIKRRNKSLIKLQFYVKQLSSIIELPEISTEVLNDLLDCSNKNQESQRQTRARFIKQVNEYFLNEYKIDDFIYREKSNFDKRFTVYKIKPEGKIKVIDLIKT